MLLFLTEIWNIVNILIYFNESHKIYPYLNRQMSHDIMIHKERIAMSSQTVRDTHSRRKHEYSIKMFKYATTWLWKKNDTWFPFQLYLGVSQYDKMHFSRDFSVHNLY